MYLGMEKRTALVHSKPFFLARGDGNITASDLIHSAGTQRSKENGPKSGALCQLSSSFHSEVKPHHASSMLKTEAVPIRRRPELIQALRSEKFPFLEVRNEWKMQTDGKNGATWPQTPQ